MKIFDDATGLVDLHLSLFYELFHSGLLLFELFDNLNIFRSGRSLLKNILKFVIFLFVVLQLFFVISFHVIKLISQFSCKLIMLVIFLLKSSLIFFCKSMLLILKESLDFRSFTRQLLIKLILNIRNSLL